jgi:hypothetical protein
MIPNMSLSALLLSFTALGAASPLSARSSGPACTYLTSVAMAPSCPGSCCGWELTTSTTPFCDATSSTRTLGLATSVSASSDWPAACGTLRGAVLATNANYILTTYQQGVDHAVVSNDGCRFEVAVADPQGEEPIRLAASDIAAYLDDAVAAVAAVGGDASLGATAGARCYAYNLQWRVVPPGN